ncbi:MAG: winged helix-turn-helix transcriptional regulator [Clostridia bacterium]|nr:winged helix-turn-helix transcriptional regulator [Clostridia bacterium]
MGLQTTLSAIADPTRRKILKLLKKSALPAGEIASKFEISAPAVSKHLKILKNADLIRSSQSGKFIIYELNTSVLEEILLWVKNIKGDKNGRD